MEKEIDDIVSAAQAQIQNVEGRLTDRDVGHYIALNDKQSLTRTSTRTLRIRATRAGDLNSLNNASGIRRVLDSFDLKFSDFSSELALAYANVKALVEYLPVGEVYRSLVEKEQRKRFNLQNGAGRRSSKTNAENTMSHTNSYRNFFIQREQLGCTTDVPWYLKPAWQSFFTETELAKMELPSEHQTSVVMPPVESTKSRSDVLASSIYKDKAGEHLRASFAGDGAVDGARAIVVSLLHLQCHACFKDRNLLLERPLIPQPTNTAEGGAASPDRATTDDETRSETRSLHSRSSASSFTRGQRNLPREDEEYWISLKGVVFRIRFDTASPGRNLYYRIVLAPIYSGQDCTRRYLSLMRSQILRASKGGDYTPAASSLLIGLALDEIAKLEGVTSLKTSKEEAAHINGIFSLFLNDFDVVGELENGEELWI